MADLLVRLLDFGTAHWVVSGTLGGDGVGALVLGAVGDGDGAGEVVRLASSRICVRRTEECRGGKAEPCGSSPGEDHPRQGASYLYCARRGWESSPLVAGSSRRRSLSLPASLPACLSVFNAVELRRYTGSACQSVTNERRRERIVCLNG